MKQGVPKAPQTNTSQPKELLLQPTSLLLQQIRIERNQRWKLLGRTSKQQLVKYRLTSTTTTTKQTKKKNHQKPLRNEAKETHAEIQKLVTRLSFLPSENLVFLLKKGESLRIKKWMSQVIEKYNSFQQPFSTQKSYHTGGDKEEHVTAFHIGTSLSGCIKVSQVLPKEQLNQFSSHSLRL